MQNVQQSNGSITHMPSFNKTITIDVEVDSIYQKLLALLPEDYKHREVLAHAIIGSAVDKGTIAYIYSPLNGFTNDIDFKIGDKIICTEKERRERYDANIEDENGEVYATPKNQTVVEADYKPNWKTRHVEIGECEVVDINLYGNDKLKVKFMGASSYASDTTPEMKEVWVSHKKSTRVSQILEVVG